MTAQDDFEELKSILSKVHFDDYDLRERIFTVVGKLSLKYLFYKDGFLNGRDSDDARGCRMCRNDAEDFIRLDLEEGLSG